MHPEEVDCGCSFRDPSGNLTANTSTEHHAHGVEATTVDEALKVNVWAHEWVVVRREGLGSTNGTLDPRSLNEWAPLYVAVHVLHEGVPVQIKETKGESRID